MTEKIAEQITGLSKLTSDRSKEPIATQSRWRETLIGIGAFIAQRLIFGILVLVVIIFLSYLGLGMAQGMAFYPALGQSALKTLGYVGQLTRGELGVSAAGSLTAVPVTIAEVLSDFLGKSLGLLTVSLLIATLVGVTLGVWAAGRRQSGWSLITILASIIGVSVPSFFAALLLQLAAIRLTQAVGRPVLPVGGFGWDKHIIMPALVLAARPIAQITRVTFVSVSDVLSQDYVRTARSKGLQERQVVLYHVIRNAAIPVLTTMGLSLRFSLSSLPVVEFFFSWPGVGFSLLKAISRQDDNLTVALILCLGILFILVNLILEVCYRLIDPRLRDALADAGRRERVSLKRMVRSMLDAVQDLSKDNLFKSWLARRKSPASPDPFRAILDRRGIELDVSTEEYQAERRRMWMRGTLSNFPFMVGAILVFGLVVLFLFGPWLAPSSPYTTQGLTYVDGEIIVPPFAPNETFLWGTDALGRDILSLILAGAQQTVLLVVLVVSARMVVGIVLGSIAGWLNGSWVDRLLLGLSETIAAFPTLLLAMTFILALGIRQGFRPFVIALCLAGWGEVMQFVRGEVMTIRPKLFIESAVALGLRTPRIVWRHVLPNLLSALISLAALEMGATLMLLGELGFVGIFIGGGAFAELHVDAAPYHYSDVPEWGALLSNVRRYARAYPWMALYPGLAFFTAILGFNLFGEGIRRMVETVGVGISRLLNRYTVAAGLLMVVGINWVQANTGSIAFYRQQANEFDGRQALAHVQALTDPALDGRALGTPGMDAAAEYVAQQFHALGLQSAGENMTYFQTRKRSFEGLNDVPQLSIDDGGQSAVYHQDFAEFVGYDRNWGQAQGKVRFVAMGNMIRSAGFYGGSYKALDGLDYSEQVLMVLSGREVDFLTDVPYDGILVVDGDPVGVERRYTLSSRDPNWQMFGTGIERGYDRPTLWINETTADRLLEGTGHTIADLRPIAEELNVNEMIGLPTEIMASVDITGTIHDRVEVRHVIGHLPGLSDSRYGGINDRMIVVMAQYDTPPPSPDGTLYPAANNNASGVAVMLEAIRTLQETGYQPYRTFLFVAYSAEGLEMGEWVYPPEVDRFLLAKRGFSSNFEIDAVVDLRGLGAGEGDGLVILAGGSMRLTDLLEQSAQQMRVKSRRGGEAVDISIIFEDQDRRAGGQEAPQVGLSWDGGELTSRRPADTLESVSEDKLEQAGRALSLSLMILGRELQY
ncbi:MAG: ABC transporter permease subunit [Chloroflexi bacterium]|nr:ABC transporter permease subunit [Chloroflexota bacterium]